MTVSGLATIGSSHARTPSGPCSSRCIEREGRRAIGEEIFEGYWRMRREDDELPEVTRSYVEIATALRERTDETHSVHGAWITYFSRPDVIEVVEAMPRDFDLATEEEPLNDARREELGRIFATSSRFERPSRRWPTRSINGRISANADLPRPI